MGIAFVEVHEREEAEIRIGFMDGDGAWSWLGREILDHGPNERTMNFGWDLTRPREINTAIHEIGHTLCAYSFYPRKPQVSIDLTQGLKPYDLDKIAA